MLECQVHTTRLMKWEAFSRSGITDLQVLFRQSYADYLQPADRPLLLALLQCGRRAGGGPLLADEYGADLLARLVETGRAFYVEGRHIRLKSGPALPASSTWTECPDGRWRPVVVSTPSLPVFALNPPVAIDPEACTCHPLHTGAPPALTTTWIAAPTMPAADVPLFCLRLAKRFPATTFPLPPGVRLHEPERITPQAELIVEPRGLLTTRDLAASVVELHDRLRLRLRFRYGEAVIDWDAAERTLSFRRQNEIVRVARDSAWEASVRTQLEDWGFKVETRAAEAGFLSFDSAVFTLDPAHSWRTRLGETFPGLDPTGWSWRFGPHLNLQLAREVDVYTDAAPGPDGSLLLDIGIDREGRRQPLLPALHGALREARRRSPLAETLRAFAAGDLALSLPGGDEGKAASPRLISLPRALVDPLTEHLHELFDRQPFAANGRARLSSWRAGELTAAGLLPPDRGDGMDAVRRLCDRLRAGIDLAPRPAPAGLHATLRPYQERGFGWLHTLADLDAGGILADDMGLGKTVQTIALLVDLHAAGRLAEGALIVAPTSVLDNWIDELARFAPALAVHLHHGADRSTAVLPSGAIIITNYPLLRLDEPLLAARTWDLIILDEAQNIRNAGSRTSLAARRLSARRRLCLTGTPVENRLDDLWTLFDFLLPGFLGDEAAFRERISKPLALDDDEAEFAALLRERLRRRIAPFVLRRLKTDVLPDLPPKTEIVHAVSMTSRQSELYAALRTEAREEIRREVAAQGIGAAKLNILARLLRLRQICCDPRLLDTGEADSADSAKLTALLDLVADLRGRGSRLLIFSQFTRMLDLIGGALHDAGHAFQMLTGETRDRAALVQRFQAGECPIFLISLRAGGTGLNLTAADSVIHYDPWWNPAVERQASDRSHRLGQEKPVFVYKLIIDDSIESRIQHLQHSKLALAAGLLNEGDLDRLELDESALDYLLAD